jgi:CBS domain-containing protein
VEELTVGDVMTTDVVTARETTPFKELVELMESKHVGGLPVCDESGRLLGIVTETDLLQVLSGQPKRATHGRVWLEWLVRSSRAHDDATPNMTARELMTSPALSIRPGTPIRAGAQRLLETGVRRLPVVDHEGRLIGIVSRQDLLRPYLRSDDSIRDEVERLLKQTLWIDPQTITVIVDRGVVELHGEVGLRSQKEILLELTRRVDGVVSVVDRLAAAEDDRQVPPQWLAKESGGADPWRRVADTLGYRDPGAH